MNWTKDLPTKVGWYWCYQFDKIRMVHIWKYKEDSYLPYTKDGRDYDRQPYYKDSMWYGPIEPPQKPIV